MKLQKFLQEEYKTTLKNRWGKTREVFLNPSRKEMDEVSGSPRFSRADLLDKGGNHIRFIGTADGKLYVFAPDLTHDEVITKMSLPAYPHAFEGIAEKRGGKWVATETHSLESNLRNMDVVGYNKRLKTHLSQDWNFINKWIDIKKYLKDLQPKIAKFYGMKKFANQLELLEKFDKAYKTYQGYAEIFINPTAKEMKEVSLKYQKHSYIRFIASPDGKTVWVFSPTIFHGTVYRDYNEDKRNKLKTPHPDDGGLWGTAKLVNGKWIFDGSDEKIPSSFNWAGLATRGIYKNKKASDGSVYPLDFNEEFKAAYKHPYNDDEIIEVFKNPSRKEMLESGRKVGRNIYLRFIANGKTKTLYTFSPTILHRFISKKIGGGFEPMGHELWGVAKKTANGWECEASDMLEASYFKKETLKRNWSWLNKWVDATTVIEKAKRGNKVDSEKLEPIKLKKGKRLVPSRKVEECLGLFAEEFKTRVKNRFTDEDGAEIYVNPSKKELETLGPLVRFIIDDKGKKAYFFPANLLHGHAARELGLPYFENGKPDFGYGLYRVIGKKVRGLVVNSENRSLARKIEGKSHWSAKYFDQEFNVKNDPMFEEFAGGAKAHHSGVYVEIFKNPTSKEMRELPDQVRFCIDGRGRGKLDVYLWDAALLHQDASETLVIPYPHPKVLWGIGAKEGNKVVSRGSDYPARDYVYNIKLLKAKNNPEKYGDMIEKFSKVVEKDYLDPKWENKWVDLSDFYKGIKELVGKDE